MKIKIEIDLMVSLLYSSIIEDAKIPEKKPIPLEVVEYWENKLAGQNPQT